MRDIFNKHFSASRATFLLLFLLISPVHTSAQTLADSRTTYFLGEENQCLDGYFRHGDRCILNSLYGQFGTFRGPSQLPGDYSDQRPIDSGTEQCTPPLFCGPPTK